MATRIRSLTQIIGALGGICILCAACLFGQTQSQQQNPSSALPVGKARALADIQSVERSLPHISDRGAASYFLAWLHAHLNEFQASLQLLKQCPLNEGFDPGDVDDFRPLSSNAEFRSLIARVHHRYSPVHRARVAFTIAQRDLFPEGLAEDPQRHIFYMGSQYHDKIVQISENGRVSEFVREGVYDLMPVGGVHVDPANHSVWVATDPGPKNRSELVHFDARGKLIERYTAPGAGPHDLNDLVLRGEKEIYVTDTLANQVYLFNRTTHRFSSLRFPRPIFYPNGITLSGDGNLLYVADMLGVLRVDLRRGTAEEVKVDGHFTLAGIDGLYWHRGNLVGIQYGAGTYRVAEWQLTANGLHVVRSRMVEYRTPLVKNPTTGAIVGDNLYFMANTGIDNLNDNNQIIDRTKLAPLQIAVVPLNWH